MLGSREVGHLQYLDMAILPDSSGIVLDRLLKIAFLELANAVDTDLHRLQSPPRTIWCCEVHLIFMPSTTTPRS